MGITHTICKLKWDSDLAEQGVVALSLVYDLVTRLGLVCTSRLFEKEARLSEPMTRDQLISRLGLPTVSGDEPLILALLTGSTSLSPQPTHEVVAVAAPGTQSTQVSQPVKPSGPKDFAQGVCDSIHDVDNSTPTRIPSFVGPTVPSPKPPLSASILSPEEASAPYALPSDSGESVDADAAHPVQLEEHGEHEHPRGQRESLDAMDMSTATQTFDISQVTHLSEQGFHGDSTNDAIHKPTPVTPIPHKQLPPLGPVNAVHGSALGTLSSPANAARRDGDVSTARDARMEGQELLGLLGSPSYSEDHELPGLQRLASDPDLLSDGDVDNAIGLDLLLPDSSSESGKEQEFCF